MSTEKPKKRLVGWKEYADALAKQGAVYSIATGVGSGGIVLLLVGAFGGLTGVLMLFSHNHMESGIWAAASGTVLSGLGLWGLSIARSLVREARKIPPVALLTNSSAKHLPEVETLVRGSDRPASAEQAELLRAAGQGTETPSEQLLRAVQGAGQDV